MSYPENDPNAFINTEVTLRQAVRNYNRERHQRTAWRAAMIEKHGPVPAGHEWVEGEDGRVAIRLIPLGGRPPMPRTVEQITAAARVVKEVAWSPETGSATVWATADYAFLIQRVESSVIAGQYAFVVGKPARDASGNIRMEVGEQVAQCASFPKARRVVKMQPVDVDALRGHPTIDPGGARSGPVPDGRMEAELASGHLSIGD